MRSAAMAATRHIAVYGILFDANKALSGKRAQSVPAALKADGIDGARLSAVGWGSEKPVAGNADDEGRARNRRVELVTQ